MRSRFRKTGLAVVLAGALFVAGCAPMTEAQHAAREYSRIDFQNRFVEERARCLASGRRIVIMSYGGGVDSNGVPRTRVPYVCS